MYSHLEEYIYQLYTSINISNPKDLDMHIIAKRLGVVITYKKTIYKFNNEIVLVKSTKQKEWINFGHELCHYLRHAGNQFNMHPLFRELQEWQANLFAYHFCVPTFMLEKINLPKDCEQLIIMLSETFNVPHDFAINRIRMYENKIQSFLLREGGGLKNVL